MTRYVALLRGIAPSLPNHGNDKLRGVLEALGFSHVSSVLSSGNICFGSDQTDLPALETQIEQAMIDQLGIRPATIIRSRETLRALLDAAPFGDLVHGPGNYLTATFLKDADAPVAAPGEMDGGTSRVIGVDRSAGAILAITDNSTPGSTPDFMGWLEKTYGKTITTRTWLTVQRIVKRLES